MKKTAEFVRKLIKGVALMSSETTSICGLYQPQKPLALIKQDKSKKK